MVCMKGFSNIRLLKAMLSSLKTWSLVARQESTAQEPEGCVTGFRRSFAPPVVAAAAELSTETAPGYEWLRLGVERLALKGFKESSQQLIVFEEEGGRELTRVSWKRGRERKKKEERDRKKREREGERGIIGQMMGKRERVMGMSDGLGEEKILIFYYLLPWLFSFRVEMQNAIIVH
ncbi:hypothetical protein DVH24_002955 [Malus domestica]|uniref:Uncharacterized protein n=1 Tax=Malus domestica TaxID=3750 RepID=A0A498K6B3_MALDO|nr:hypothetical protein DVH24_002955 [Malus domestica]